MKPLIASSLYSGISRGSIDLRKLLCSILVIVALMDSSIMWNAYILGKGITYFLKLLICFSIPFLLKRNYLKNYWLFLILIPFAWGTIDESSLILSIQYFFSAGIPLLAFILLKEDEQLYIAEKFIKVFIVLVIIGIPFYILLNITLLPHLTFTREDGRTYYNFFFLYFTNGYGTIQTRFSSVFDEPGVVGTFIALFLLYYRKFLTQSHYIILTIVGFFTFSFFFILVAIPILYLSDLRYQTIQKQIKKMWIFVFVILISYIGFVFFARSTNDGTVMESLIYNRFEWNNNWIVGVHNNRDLMSGFEEGYSQFISKKNLAYWIGNGKNSALNDFGSSGLSYRIYWYEKGLLSLAFISIVFIFLHDWRKQFWFSLFSMCFLILLFFQRPYLYSFNFFMLIYVGLKLIPGYVKKLENKVIIDEKSQ